MILFTRSLIFNLLFLMWTILICICCSPLLFCSFKIVAYAGRWWGFGTLWLLKYVCNLKLKVIGEENLPKGSFIVASKHQSELETIMFHAILNKPVYVLKQELTKIPLIGYYFKKMGMIIINRAGHMNALKQMIIDSGNRLKDGRPVIIFPEGTRTKPYQMVKYHPGIAALYANSGYPVIPAATNSGVFWPKNSFWRKPGTFTIEFLPVIKPKLNKNEFLSQLQQVIETNSLKLIEVN